MDSTANSIFAKMQWRIAKEIEEEFHYKFNICINAVEEGLKNCKRAPLQIQYLHKCSG